MIKLVHICLFFLASFLCCRLDQSSVVEEAKEKVYRLASQDFSCFSSLNVSIGDTTYNIFQYLSGCCLMANSIHQTKPLGYYCACAPCNVIDEFSNLYYYNLRNIHGPYLDSSMSQTCEKYKDIYSVYGMCQGLSRLHVGTFILNNLHHFRDSLYITDDELLLSQQFVSEFNSDPYAINYCNYVSQWSGVNKKSPSNGLFSAILLATAPSLLVNRADLITTAGLGGSSEEDKAQYIWAYVLWAGYHAWAGAMTSIFEKGCEGLQDDQAGKMILRDAGKNCFNSI